MKEDHKNLCIQVLDTLIEYPDMAFFNGPAVDALEDGDSNVSKSKYREIVTEPRDMKMIRENVMAKRYSSIAAFENDGTKQSSVLAI
jgi:hypothetical protein